MYTKTVYFISQIYTLKMGFRTVYFITPVYFISTVYFISPPPVWRLHAHLINPQRKVDMKYNNSPLVTVYREKEKK